MDILPQEQTDFEIRQHITGGLSDQLYDAYLAGRADESGAHPPSVRSVTTAALLMLVRRRYIFEHANEPPAALGEEAEPLLAPDEVPGWLLAHAERQHAFGPAPLPPLSSSPPWLKEDCS